MWFISISCKGCWKSRCLRKLCHQHHREAECGASLCLGTVFSFSRKAKGIIVGPGLYLPFYPLIRHPAVSSVNSEHIHLDLLSRPSLWELLLLSVLPLPVSKRYAFLPAKPKQWGGQLSSRDFAHGFFFPSLL